MGEHSDIGPTSSPADWPLPQSEWGGPFDDDGPDTDDRDNDARCDSGVSDSGDVPPDHGLPDVSPVAGVGAEGLGPDPALERRTLLDLVMYAYDRTTSVGIRARLAEGLQAVGVDVLIPDGERFDPTRHEVGGTEPTDDPDRHDTVAETELAGFLDRGAVIREPVVVVYRLS